MYSYDKAEPPELRLHLHNFYEFLYFKGGNASYIVENTLYTASPGDLFITRPDEMHTISFHSDDLYERHFIQISPEYMKDVDFDLLYLINQKQPGTMNRIPADIVKSYGLDEYFTMVEQYVVNRVPESDILIKTYIIQMIVKINSALREYSEPSVDVALDDTRIIEIKKFIDKHINEYINARRITIAKQMIFEGYNITSVCFECGFKDYSNFYKTFKKFTDKSPREFFKSFGYN